MKVDKKNVQSDPGIAHRIIEFEDRAIKELKIPMDLGARLDVN